jgi:hypothetical protein
MTSDSASACAPPFTFRYYRSMLERALAAGYDISSFARHHEFADRLIILRHDVDYTLNGVSELAAIEHSMGVTSTYFFRVHAHEYNLFTPHVYDLIRKLQALGHEIGLHFEALTFARALALEPKDVLAREKRVLELILDHPIISASEHRDISQVVHGTPNYHDLYNPLDAGFRYYALAPEFFGGMKYLSDSNGFWREGDLTEHLGSHRRFQVLVHPDWWFEKDLLLKGPYFHGLGN